jgi:hypothetical protein
MVLLLLSIETVHKCSKITDIGKDLMMEQGIALKGVQFVVDASGKRTAVIISLDEWGKLWEDFYDVLVSEERRGESTVSWEALKAESQEDVQS